MIEKINVNGRDVWIRIESHVVNNEDVFTAAYSSVDPESAQAGILLIDDRDQPILFKSPVEALEYCTEKLLGMDDSAAQRQ